MREINRVVVHCSATPPRANVDVTDIRKWHKDRGWSDIGYHYVIKRDGEIQEGRDIEIAGAHARGHNEDSVAICLVGGVDSKGEPDCNYTYQQYKALVAVAGMFWGLPVTGHRELSPDLDGDGTIDASERLKECPCFDVEEFFNNQAL